MLGLNKALSQQLPTQKMKLPLLSILFLSLLSFTQKTTRFFSADDNMVYIEGGVYEMGCTEGSTDCRNDELPTHKVSISGFYLSKYEVTQKEYLAVMGTNPSHFQECPDCPVESVCWYDAVAFCNRKSIQEGLSPYYTIDENAEDTNNTNSYDDLKWLVTINPNAKGYRLPTEAEWEYAARGGNKGGASTKYAGSNESNAVAWTKENSEKHPHAVGQKQANELGIYDMSGNISEWCWDWRDKYKKKMQTNPMGPSKGAERAYRGGSWVMPEKYARVSHRDLSFAQGRSFSMGFRVAKSE